MAQEPLKPLKDNGGAPGGTERCTLTFFISQDGRLAECWRDDGALSLQNQSMKGKMNALHTQHLETRESGSDG